MKNRCHQITGTQFILDHSKRTIIADIAGLGKTKTVLDAVFKPPIYQPTLILCNRPGLSVWENELLKWYNEPSHIYSGTPKKRKQILQDFITTEGANFLITTYAMFDEIIEALTPNFFQTLIMDEYHLFGMLNRKTNIYKQVNKVKNIIPKIIMMTGTPMRQTPADWYAPLSIVYPNNFKGYWDFVREYCITIKDRFGIHIERVPLNSNDFRSMLDKYRRRFTDKSYLPPKIRQPIPIEMTQKQQKLYDQLRKEMYIEEDGQFIITPNKMTNVLRARQLMVCPTILGFNDKGRAIEIIRELVEEELSEGNPCIIFTPFRKAIPIIQKELEKIKDLKIYIIHGGMDYEYHKQVQNDFQTTKTKNKVVICTIKSGTTMTLTEANIAIFIGYEFGLHDNLQAEDRIHRETQEKKTRIYYLLYKNSVDQRGIDILNDKSKALAIDISEEDYYKELINVKN